VDGGAGAESHRQLAAVENGFHGDFAQSPTQSPAAVVSLLGEQDEAGMHVVVPQSVSAGSGVLHNDSEANSAKATSRAEVTAKQTGEATTRQQQGSRDAAGGKDGPPALMDVFARDERLRHARLGHVGRINGSGD